MLVLIGKAVHHGRWLPCVKEACLRTERCSLDAVFLGTWTIPSLQPRSTSHTVLSSSPHHDAMQVLEGYQRVLGPEHPHTLTSMNNVATAMSRQGKAAEAEALHRQVIWHSAGR